MTVRHLDRLHCSGGDAYLMRALGLIASGAFLILWAGLRLTLVRSDEGQTVAPSR